jgi:glutamate formiminotransferase/formiminotetrahydrofolate cyclodeaminase
VPNFSEGRDPALIEQIAQSIRAVEGVQLLDIDPGPSANRTVMTFVGSPEAVVEAAFQAIKTAASLIDMSSHQGEHPRIGATDVCPLVPVSGITVEEAVEYAHDLAERVGRELSIPVYLYEYSATAPHRRNLAEIRSGEYEGLAEKMQHPDWRPDYGPEHFQPACGATVIGVRDFLVAYNINLNTRSAQLANAVAMDLREIGRAKLEKGQPVLDEAGKAIRIPGLFKGVKAIGWYMDTFGIAQVSANITRLEEAAVHEVFEAAVESAARRGLRVTGSELVGLIPKKCLTDAGRYYLRRQGRSEGVSEEELIELAVRSLGLQEVKPFDASQKVIEYLISGKRESFSGRTLRAFCNEVASESPAPGGGSVAAVLGALGASLAAMVANLSMPRKRDEALQMRFSALALKAQEIKDRLLRLADEDTEAFQAVMAAYRLPKDSEPAQARRQDAIQAALRQAAEKPFEAICAAYPTYDLLEALAAEGNPNAATDAAVGALAVHAALQGAALNVQVNLTQIEDADWKGRIGAETAEFVRKSEMRQAAVIAAARSRAGL